MVAAIENVARAANARFGGRRGLSLRSGALLISASTLALAFAPTRAAACDGDVAAGTTLQLESAAEQPWTDEGNVCVGTGSGSSASAELLLGGGVAYSGNSLTIGSSAPGLVVLTGAGTSWTLADMLTMGGSASGVLNLREGAAFTAGGAIDIASGANSSATLSITGGARFTGGALTVGAGAGSMTDITVSGPGSSWTTSQAPTHLRIGTGANSTVSITVSDGASFTDTSSQSIYLGGKSGSMVNVLVTGVGTRWNSGNLLIGDTATPTVFTVSDGAVVSTAGGTYNGQVGINGGFGTLIVTGAGSSFSSSNGFHAGQGYGGRASIQVLDGGHAQLGSANYGSYVAASANSSASILVSGSGSSLAGGANLQLAKGDNSVSSLEILAGGQTALSKSGYIAYVAPGENSRSSIRVSDAGSALTTSANTYIAGGDGSVSDIEILNGGKATFASGTYNAYIADGANSHSSILVSGEGALLNLRESRWATGRNSLSELAVTNGAIVASSGEPDLAYSTDSTASALVSGPGSQWNIAASGLVLGYGKNSTGSLTIADGGTLRANPGSTSSIIGLGYGLESSGSITVTGGGSSLAAVLFRFGYEQGATGELLIADGGTVSTGDSSAQAIGYNPGGKGVVTITGAGSSWTNTQGSFRVGGSFGGSGELTIANGGLLSTAAADEVGFLTGGDGAVTITGAGSRWTNAGGSLAIGGTSGGNGSVTLADGGTLSVGTINLGASAGSGLLVIGADRGQGSVAAGMLAGGTLNIGARGTLLLNHTGGAAGDPLLLSPTLSTQYGSRIFVDSGATVFVDPNVGGYVGAIASGASLTFAQSGDTTLNAAVGGAGALVKDGAGTLTLSADSDYTGETSVRAGTLNVVGGVAGGQISVLSGARLTGTGIIAGPVVIADGATLAGISGNTLRMGGLALASGSAIEAELGIPGGALFAVDGDIVLDGTLNIISAVGSGGLSQGVHRLFDYSGQLLDQGLQIGSVPSGTATNQFTVQVTTGQVNVLSQAGNPLQFWDGTDAIGNGATNGGSGTWNAAGTNWTNADGTANLAYNPASFSIFQGQGGTVTLAAATSTAGMQFVADGYTVTGSTLTLGSASRLVRVGDGTSAGAGTTATISSILAGPGGLIKSDYGTLVLTAANTFSGGVKITGGTLQIAAANNLGNSSATLSIDGGTLRTTAGSITLGSRPVSIGRGGATFAVGGTQLTASATNLTGLGTITKQGAGILVASGSNTAFAGALDLRAGEVRISGGAFTNASTLTLDGGALTLTSNASASAAGVFVTAAGGSLGNNNSGTSSNRLLFTGGLSGSGVLTKTGSGIVALEGPMDFAGSVVLAAGTLQLAPQDDTVWTSAISGAGNFTKAGARALTLVTAAGHTGTTTVSGGALRLVGAGGLAGGGGIAVSGAGSALLVGAEGSLTEGIGASAVSLGSGASMVFDHAGTASTSALAVGGNISGAGSLSFLRGTTTLAGSNSYTGGTRIGGGAVAEISASGQLGTGLITLAGGTLRNTGADVQLTNGLTLTSGVIDGQPVLGSTIDTGTGNLALDGDYRVVTDGVNIARDFTLTKLGSGTLALRYAGPFFNGTTRVVDGTLALIGQADLNGPLILESGTFLDTTQATIPALVGRLSGSGTILVGANGVTTDYASDADTLFTGALVGTGEFLKTGAGTLSIAADTSAFGGTMRVSNGLLKIVGDLDADMTIAAGGTVRVGNGNGVIVNYTGDTVADGTLIFDQGTDYTYSGALSGSGAVLALVTAGQTLTLGGDFTFLGTARAEGGGRLVLAGALQDGTALGVGGGTEVDLSSGDPKAVTTLTDDVNGVGGTVTLGGNTLIIGSGVETAQANEFSGSLTGTGAITKEGLATLTLDGDNSGFTGETSVTGGGLVVGGAFGGDFTVNTGGTLIFGENAVLTGDGTPGDVGDLALGGGTLVFEKETIGTYGGTIAGTGTIDKAGEGTFTLSGNLSEYTGVLGASAGTLVVASDLNNDVILGAGNLGVVDISNADQTVGGLSGTGGSLIIGATTLTVDQPLDSLFSGALVGDGALVKTDEGTLTLDGDNSGFTGQATIGSGGLVLAGEFAGDVAVSSAGTLTLDDRADLTGDIVNSGVVIAANTGAASFAGAMTGDGEFAKTGTGTLTLSGDSSAYAGATRLDAGQLVLTGSLGGSIGIGTDATLTLAGNGSALGDLAIGGILLLTQAQDGTLAGALSGDGEILAQGAGTITFTGDGSAFTGATSVSGGVLVVDNVLGGTMAIDAQGSVAISANGSFAGDIQADGALAITRAQDGTYAGSLSGGGALTKEGAGTLLLSGDSSGFTGVTAVAGGGLTLVGALGGSVAVSQAGTFTLDSGATFGGAIANDGLLVLDREGDSGFANLLTGSGTVAKSGAGTLTLTSDLSGYAGTLAVAGGTLDVATALNTSVALDLSAGQIDLGSASQSIGGLSGTGGTLALGQAGSLAIAQDGDTVFAGDIAGDEATVIAKSGTGSLALTGDGAAFTGSFVVDQGMLSLAGNYDNDVAIGGGGTLALAQADREFTGALSGSGAILRDGAGTVTLAGDTSLYTGTATIADGGLALVGSFGGNVVIDAGGTVQVGTMSSGANGLRGDLLGSAVNNGTLVFDQGDAEYTFSGGLSGSGSLVKQGSGLLVLAGSYSYTGTTTVLGGTVRLDATLDPTSGIAVGGGTLDLGDRDQTVASLSGGGTGVLVIGDAGSLTVDQSTDTQFGGGLSGAGDFVKEGTGTLALTGDNSGFTGTTNVGGGEIVLTGSLGGAVGIGSEGTLTFGTGSAFAGDIANAGTLNIDRSDDQTYTGTLTGSGTLVKAGSGTLTLGGDAADFTGTTSVSAGDLVLTGTLGGDVGIAPAGTVTLADGSQFDGDIANAGTLRIERNDDQNYSGSLTGDGSLIKQGTGTLTLTGDNGAFTGLANVLDGEVAIEGALGANLVIGSAGTVIIADNAALTGTIVNAGLLQIDRDQDGTFAGALGGSGTIAKSGSGVFVLAGDLSEFAGAILADGGALTIASPLGREASLVLAGGTIDLGNATQSIAGLSGEAGTLALRGGILSVAVQEVSRYAGALTGEGTFIKSGDQVLTLAGDSRSYTGTLSAAAGTLRLATDLNDAVSLSLGGGTIELAGTDQTVSALSGTSGTLSLADADLTVNQRADATFGGQIEGSGRLIKLGEGKLSLGAESSYSGGTDVIGGTLVGSAASFGSGEVTVDARLELVADSNADFANRMLGSGTVVKQGAGRLNYLGSGEGFSGTTWVESGSLAINGTLGGKVVVAGGALLGGSGSIDGDVLVNASGTLSPGNSPGTLTIAGDLTLAANSVLAVELTPDAYDQLKVGGTATIEGAAMTISVTGDLLRPGASFNILDAATVEGSFGSVTMLGANTTPFLSFGVGYTAQAVTVEVERSQVSFASVATTANQRASAAAFDRVGNVVGDRITVMTVDAARSAFDALSGEFHASLRNAALEDGRQLRQVVLGRASAPGAGERSAWLQALGNFGKGSADGNAAALDRNSFGIAGGLDYPLGEDGRVGLSVGHVDTDLRVAARSSSGKLRSTHVLGYASAPIGAVSLSGGIGWARYNASSQRNVTVGTLVQNLDGHYYGHLLQGFGEAALPVAVGQATVSPFIGMAVARASWEGFRESGGDTSLAGAGEAQTTGTSIVGLAVRADTEGFALSGRVGWQHGFGDRTSSVTFVPRSGGSAFDIAGTSLSRDALVIEAGAAVQLLPGMELEASYSGQLGGAAQDHAIKGTLSIRF